MLLILGQFNVAGNREAVLTKTGRVGTTRQRTISPCPIDP
ncbi:unnamed protein product [Acidithrix sp. C25]|nr:unnamed protein product [Acidithrix sp. C25]